MRRQGMARLGPDDYVPLLPQAHHRRQGHREFVGLTRNPDSVPSDAGHRSLHGKWTVEGHLQRTAPGRWAHDGR